LPIRGVFFQHYSLAGDIFFQSKRPQSRKLIWQCRERPGMREISASIGLFQQVPRNDRQTVEDPFGGSVRLRQLEAHRIVVHLLNLDGLSPDNEKVALRRMHLFVQIEMKAEKDVVCVQWLAIRKTQTLPEVQRVLFPIA